MASEYEVGEAREILARASGDLARNRMHRLAAAETCLAAFAQLIEALGANEPVFYSRIHSGGSMEFGRLHTGRWISIEPTDFGFELRVPQAPAIPLKLSYNSASGLLEGSEEDPFISPTPGQPRRYRSALAILAEAAIKAVSEESPAALWEKMA